ncbi:hypothetical protein TWF506_007540 [Arthrobotrys conoides]|uniref:Uncharacterized protein n=1 Tax=Arthrobotrys conoides TaxID=74498 RepID=A0AAN8NAP4_9PEZI
MHLYPLSPLFSILILILPPKVSCWYLLTLRQDRKWAANNKPVSTSWLRDIPSLTECVPNQNNRNKPSTIDAIALYNRPGNTIAPAVAIYSNSFCGVKNANTRESVKVGTHVPDILLLPDQNKLEGIHLFDIKDIGIQIAAKFYRAIDPVEEAASFGGLLYESESKPGVYWWDGVGTWKRYRHLGEERRVRYVDGSIADYLFSSSALYNYVRLLLEFFVSPERMGGEEEALKGYRRIAEREAVGGAAAAVDRGVLGIGGSAVASAPFHPIQTAVPSSSELEDKIVSEVKPQTDVNGEAGHEVEAGDTQVQQQPRMGLGYLPLVLPTIELPFSYLPWGYEQFQSGLTSSISLEVLKGIQEILGIKSLANPNPFEGLERTAAPPPIQLIDEIQDNTSQEVASGVISGEKQDIVPGSGLGLISGTKKRKGGEVIVIDDDDDDEEDIPALKKKMKAD